MPVSVTLLAPENETQIAYRLADKIRAAWPDLGPDDRVEIVVGLQMVREIDIAVIIDLQEPRIVPAVQRRDGTTSEAQFVQSALLLIEVKQFESNDLTAAGADVFTNWGRPNQKSVAKQLKDEVDVFNRWRSRYGLPFFWVHGLAWLVYATEDASFADVDPHIVTGDASWSTMLDGLAQRESSLYATQPDNVRAAIRRIGEILARPRPITQRDRRRLDRLTSSRLSGNALRQAVAALGNKQVRIGGRAGAGKSTLLAMLCRHAWERGERVLVLAYHLALCNELEQLVRSIAGTQAFKDGYVAVHPIADFLADAYDWLYAPLSSKNGKRDYDGLKTALVAATSTPQSRERLAANAAELRAQCAESFGFDYIFIDEAQDCHDAERDFLRCCYAPETFVLADGLDQLVRRFDRCDWNRGVSPGAREFIELPQSLRMSQNVARFVNEVGIAADMPEWEVRPHPELLGGRIIIYEGDACGDRELFEGLLEALQRDRATPDDLLVTVWHDLVDKTTRESRVAHSLRSWGYEVWDGVTGTARALPPASSDCIRVVQYDSVRGLEGWCTVPMELDAFFSFRRDLPNAEGCESDDDHLRVAKRALFMALTRAAHTLVITLKDPGSQVAAWIKEAAAAMPAETIRLVPGLPTRGDHPAPAASL